MKKILFFFTILGSTLSFAQTTITSFLGDWNQSDGKLLKITALANSEGDTKARYNYGNYYYNSSMPTPTQYNYVVVYNASENSITFSYVNIYIDYLNITTYHNHKYTVNSLSQNQMTLTNTINGEVLTYTKGVLATSELVKSSKEMFLAENPVQNDLILKLPKGNQNIPIKIYSAEGKLVKKLTYTENERADVSDLPKGNYIVEIENKNQISTIKMIKD